MNKILIFFVVSSFLSCQTTNKMKSKTDSVIITLDKKSGRGINPTYSLKIYESGKLILIGEKNIDKIGNYKKQLSQKEIKNLNQKFTDAHFFNFKDEYTSKITDLPTTYISFTHKGKTKKIRDYHGSPIKLKELEKLIEKIVSEKDWQKIK